MTVEKAIHLMTFICNDADLEREVSKFRSFLESVTPDEFAGGEEEEI